MSARTTGSIIITRCDYQQQQVWVKIALPTSIDLILYENASRRCILTDYYYIREAPLLGKQGRIRGIRARAHVCLDSRVDECVGGNILISPLSSRPPQKKVHPHIHPLHSGCFTFLSCYSLISILMTLLMEWRAREVLNVRLE